MEKGAKAKGIIFLLVLLIFIVGGFIFMKKSSNPKDNKKENNEEVEPVEIRIDPSKAYIYFEDKEEIVDELDIYYEKIVFNFKETTGIEEKLNAKNKELKESLKYDKEMEEESYNKLKSAEYMTYEVYAYDKYMSLVVKYYTFDRENLVLYQDSETYIFNIEDGHLYTDDEILNNFNVTEDAMYEMIKDTVDGEALLREGEELDSNATVKAIKDPSLYVDKIGRLTISVLVKSDKNDYNEDIILN